MNNTVVLVGRITKDLELRTTEKGVSVCRFTIAINRNYKNTDGVYETDFINCTAYSFIAKNMSEYCRKGDLIGVKGRIQTGSYEKEGKKIYTQDIVAEKITFLSSSSKKEESKEETSSKTEQVAEEPKVDPWQEFANEITITDDDLPF